MLPPATSCPASHQLSTIVHRSLGTVMGRTTPVSVESQGMNVGSTVDDRVLTHTPSPTDRPTCATLGTTTGQCSGHLTCTDVWLSPIHRAYYHHQTLISILSGESEYRP